jgi:hypothetical protein
LTIIINALQALSSSTLAISESLISPNAFRSGSSTRFRPNRQSVSIRVCGEICGIVSVVDDAECGSAGQLFVEDAVVDRRIHDEHQQKESKICGNDQNGTLKQI